MKELVGKLSRGIIEYNGSVIDFTESEIEAEVAAGSLYEGSFNIKTDDLRKIKGVVYTTNRSVRIINRQFVGSDIVIRYEVDAEVLNEGDKVDGKFCVVSDGGEGILRYSFKVVCPKINVSVGEINDLFQFAGLMKNDYEEAIKIFISPEFKDIFLRDDLYGQALYDGVINSKDKKQALEEFLVGIKKKNNVTLSVSDSNREYVNLTQPNSDVVVISKDVAGYVDIKVDVRGDFITNCKTRITSDDFAGSNYEYKYLIDTDRLHDGMNYGTITFQTVFQSLTLQISVDNTHDYSVEKREVKKCIRRLMKMYIDFRCRRYTADVWSEKSLSIIERARGFDDSYDFLKLIQAQIYLTRNKEAEAAWLLDSVANNILDNVDDNLELYCYYLYVRTLQRRDHVMTNDIFLKIKSYYDGGYDSWRILWILLYLDNSYESNVSLKVARIKEQFNKGCYSPLMYYEAINVFNKQPQLLRVINDFELQVLMFGCKYEIIEEKLAIHVAEIALLEKNFRPIMFKVLTYFYDMFGKKEILNAICSVLIRSNITGSKYFKWYAEGVKRELNLTRLYEYYMFTISDRSMELLPNIIYMYFVYNGNLLFHRESYLYANIIHNKEKIPNIYKNYKANMERFALDNLSRGNMNRNLAIVYREFLQGSVIKDEIAKNLPHILATHELICDNKNMCKVIVIHKEIASEKVYVLRDGIANIEIFTEDAIVMAEDMEGNRHFKTVNFAIRKLLDNNSLMSMCEGKCDDDIYYVAAITEQFLKYHNSSGNTINTFKNIMQMDRFRYSFKKSIMKDIIDYYYENYDGDELDDYLKSIDLDEIDLESRIKVIELLIMRGLYEESYEAVKNYGYVQMAPGKLLKLVSRYLVLVSSESDELLTELAAFAFVKGKYNESTLSYLCENYNGITKDMIEIWKAGIDYSVESRDLEERLIAQILFSRAHTGYLVDIFDSYEKKGANETVKKAYYFYVSYNYFVKEKPVNDKFFIQLERELLIQAKSHDILHELCKIAYLRYVCDLKEPQKKQIELSRKLLVDMADKNINFEFFKRFGKWFEIPDSVAMKAVIEYRTSPDCEVYIHYNTEKGAVSDHYERSQMESKFKGIYTKELPIFYGENIRYYITEENLRGTNITESENYYLGDDIVCVNNTAYGMINDILRCMDMKEETTVRELTKEYYINLNVAKKAFDIL